MIAPRTSHLAPRDARLAPRASHLAPRASHLAPRASLLALIGNTPLVRLEPLETAGSRVYAKLEWQNPGGSVKDRAAARMIADGKTSGALLPGARSSTRRRATPASPTR